MITLSVTPPSFAYAMTNDTYGGKTIHIQFTDEVIRAVTWANEYKDKLDKEFELRNNNPALANMWEQYQTMLKLVNDSE
jgi:hypothetical protein